MVKGVGKSAPACEVWHVHVARVSNGTTCRKNRETLYIRLHLGNRRRGFGRTGIAWLHGLLAVR